MIISGSKTFSFMPKGGRCPNQAEWNERRGRPKEAECSKFEVLCSRDPYLFVAEYKELKLYVG